MKLKTLTLEDRPLFEKYLAYRPHVLSSYAFSNIYLWNKLFKIKWCLLEDNLCVFFQDSIGCFLYLPPLGEEIAPSAVKAAFEIMDQFNRNQEISRLENIEEKELPFYRKLGYLAQSKFGDYLCLSKEMAALKGNKFKHQRAAYNYFRKNYRFQYLPFSLRYKDACLKLYGNWSRQRKSKNTDPVYQGMLEDSRICLVNLLYHYQKLNLSGRVVKIGGQVKAFSFGFPLNKNTFCILYEITDLSIKGLAQFIFCSFTSELKTYRYINIMDDSGLENLKKVKLSYHPVREIPNYVIRRPG